MSKSVYVRVVHDLELLSMFFVVRSNDSFNFPLGLIKYIVIVIVKCPTQWFFRVCPFFLSKAGEKQRD